MSDQKKEGGEEKREREDREDERGRERDQTYLISS
jgi:hypothetical protein